MTTSEPTPGAPGVSSLHGDDYTRDARCELCLLTPRLCVCSAMPRVSVAERFVVIRHATELGKHSNTGGLVPAVLENSVLVDHGIPEGPFDRSVLQDPGQDYAVLYPGPKSTELQPTPPDAERPRTIVVLDGTWRKARRMLIRIDELRDVPLVHLPDRPPLPGLRLRKSRDPEWRFTLEAVGEALGALGHSTESTSVLEFAARVVQRRLAARGKISRHDLR